MRGLFTSALFASTWVTTLTAHGPGKERSHNVAVDDSSNNVPIEPIIQRLPQQLELPDRGDTRLRDEDAILSQRCLEDAIAQLKYMRAQLRELQILIAEQQLVVAQHSAHLPILECDSLACVFRSLGNQARRAAATVVVKCKGSISSEKLRHSLTSSRLRTLPRRPVDQGAADSGDMKALTGDARHKSEHRPQCHPSPWKKLGDLQPTSQYPPPSHSSPSTPHRLLQNPSRHTPFKYFTAEPRDDRTEDHAAHTGIATSSFTEPRPAQRPTRLSAAEASGIRRHLLNPLPNPPHYKSQQLPAAQPASRGSQRGLSLMIVLSVFIVAALHRRWRRSAAAAALPRVERCQSRRAERFYRRAMRRAAQQQVISDVLARLGHQRCSTGTTREDEEKGGASLSGRVDGASPYSRTMGDEISEFRSVADIVGELVAAEEGRSRRSRARGVPECDSVGGPAAGLQELSRHCQDASADVAVDGESPVYETEEKEEKRITGGIVDGSGFSSATAQDAGQADKESEDSEEEVKP